MSKFSPSQLPPLFDGQEVFLNAAGHATPWCVAADATTSDPAEMYYLAELLARWCALLAPSELRALRRVLTRRRLRPADSMAWERGLRRLRRMAKHDRSFTGRRPARVAGPFERAMDRVAATRAGLARQRSRSLLSQLLESPFFC